MIPSLEQGIKQLEEDKTHGARVLATNALKSLQGVISELNLSSASDFWQQCRIAGYRLSLSRPSMAAAITSVVVDGLDAVRTEWTNRWGATWGSLSTDQDIQSLRDSAYNQLTDRIKKREASGENLSDCFLDYISHKLKQRQNTIRILTLSSSSSVAACLCHAITSLPAFRLEINILESRPRCEGATFAMKILNDIEHMDGIRQVNVIVAPDSHVCSLAKNVDIVLLGADRISSEGDVSNKMGSLAAALCAKQQAPSVEVVVISETDKIARPGSLEAHKAENNDPNEVIYGWTEQDQVLARSLLADGLEVQNIYFEWVPTSYIDTYVTENGVLKASDISEISRRKGNLEDEYFDDCIQDDD